MPLRDDVGYGPSSAQEAPSTLQRSDELVHLLYTPSAGVAGQEHGVDAM